MNKTIKFKKYRILLAIVFSFLMISISFWFVKNPELFVRNVLMKPNHIVILGIISLIYYSMLLFSFVNIYSRNIAIILSDEYLEDYSRYEAVGKIHWSEVIKIDRISKNAVEIRLKTIVSKREGLSVLKKMLLFMHNFNYNRTIIISSALLECDIEDLEKMITTTHNNYKIKKKLDTSFN